ncbi:MAG: hypothetical protein RMJ97_11085 [Raineya sp.]|nr:hypothetical protein [Raineya sp.]
MKLLPSAFLERISDFLPENQDKFLSSLSESPVVSLRLNPFKKLNHLPFSPMCAVAWCEDGYYLSQRPSFTENPLFWAGAFYVQEASSMFLEQIFKHIHSEKFDFNLLAFQGGAGGGSDKNLKITYKI